MKAFKDKNGKNWLVEVTVGTIKKVKAVCDIDLSQLVMVTDEGVNGDVLSRLCEDPVLLASVIYSVCMEEADNQKLSEDEFFKLFDGDAVEKATDALIQEIIDFFPPAKRMVLKKIYEKSQTFGKRANSMVENLLKDESFNQDFDSQLNSMLTNSQE